MISLLLNICDRQMVFVELVTHLFSKRFVSLLRPEL